MVVALLALFVCLGGSSYAALRISKSNLKTSSVGTRALANNSVRSRDIRNGNVFSRDVKNGALTGTDFQNNSLTGNDILESSLGQVPSATTAGNVARVGSVSTASFANSAGNTGLVGNLHVHKFHLQVADNPFPPNPAPIGPTAVEVIASELVVILGCPDFDSSFPNTPQGNTPFVLIRSAQHNGQFFAEGSRSVYLPGPNLTVTAPFATNSVAHSPNAATAPTFVPGAGGQQVISGASGSGIVLHGSATGIAKFQHSGDEMAVHFAWSRDTPDTTAACGLWGEVIY